jgi:hypothetical protein
VKVVTDTWDGPVTTWHEYVVGVDWGKSEDFTAISVVSLTTMQEVHLERFNKIDYVFQAKRLAAVAARFKPVVIVAEANAMGTPIIDRLARGDSEHGIPPLPIQPFTTTNESKKQIVENLALALENLNLRILPDETANEELRAFEIRTLPSGKTAYGAPEGVHDDTVIARCLAWHAADTGGVEYAESPYG